MKAKPIERSDGKRYESAGHAALSIINAMKRGKMATVKSHIARTANGKCAHAYGYGWRWL